MSADNTEVTKRDIQEDLEKIYADVSEWLKYAEAKHAAFVALWAALLVGVLSTDQFWTLSYHLMKGSIIFIIIGMTINIAAFTPFSNRVDALKNDCLKKYKGYGGNLIFYQSIFVSVYTKGASLEDQVNRYKSLLLQNYGEVSLSKSQIDYIKQIVEVATVATIKTYLFTVANMYLVFIIFLSILFVILL